jgi:hypothetical protein
MLVSLMGLAMTVTGLIGLVEHWGSTSASAGTHPTTTTATAERPQEFFASFVEALRTGDTTFLKARLDPAVTARYGTGACDGAVAQLADPHVALHLVRASGPADYAYRSDGRTATVHDTYVTGTTAGRTGPRDYHFALSGGTFHLFLDCGTPP